MPTTLQHPLLEKFSCLGDKCEDTCCKGWSMQLDDATLARYKKEAPELLDAVEPAEESPWIMRKDPKTTYCVKYEDGLCGIHKERGDSFLGDACHFYPRSTRSLGDSKIMTATLSCPEVSRLALFEKAPFAFYTSDIERLPYTMKDYLPEGISAEDAVAVHTAFIAATEDEANAETILARIASVSRSIELIDKKSWAQAVPFYLKNADMRLPDAQVNPADPFNVLHALCGLIVATQKPISERLKQTIDDMEKALHVKLDWQNVLIQLSDDSGEAWQKLESEWQKNKEQYQPILKRYLQMQLSLALYPFSGLGSNLSERVTIIGVRLATIKLAIITACGIYGASLPQDTVVRLVQSLSRFLDHLGDPAFSLQIYAETGWDKEPRMRGLLAA
ncbi:MAG: flagellin lysine-N-methylase [Rickettsiales bacterium]